jgi:hypothetical protein
MAGAILLLFGCNSSASTSPAGKSASDAKGIYGRAIRCLAALDNLAEALRINESDDARFAASHGHMRGILQASAELSDVSLQQTEADVRAARSQPDLQLKPESSPIGNDQRVAQICRGILPRIEGEMDLPPLMSPGSSNKPVVVNAVQEPIRR